MEKIEIMEKKDEKEVIEPTPEKISEKKCTFLPKTKKNFIFLKILIFVKKKFKKKTLIFFSKNFLRLNGKSLKKPKKTYKNC